MREIKFRAWDKIDKKMLTVRELRFFKTGELESIIIDYSAYGDATQKSPSDIILIQFTDLKEKNGKELWEGDLIQNESGRICEVQWFNYYGQWDALVRKTVNHDNSNGFSPESWKHSVEKIGNIYENPELLKEATCQEKKKQKKK